MRTTPIYYRVDRRQISMIRFVFEAYEGIAVVTTLDAAAGTIVLAVSPGCESMVKAIMKDLGKSFRVEPVQPAERTMERNQHAQ